MTASLLAFFFGGLGVHQFYLGRNKRGVLYFLFAWTFIPALLALIDLFKLIIMDEDEFNQKYNGVSPKASSKNEKLDKAIKKGAKKGLIKAILKAI